MDEKLIATLNKKNVYIPLLLGTLLFVAAAGIGTYYFFMRPSNIRSSAVVEKNISTNDDSRLTEEEKDLNALDDETDLLDLELSSANSGLNDTQTDLTY